MNEAEGKCTAKMGKVEELREDDSRKKLRRKVSENRKENEGDTSKDARERQRKEVGHTEVEPFFSSSVCCSLVLHWRVSVIVTIIGYD